MKKLMLLNTAIVALTMGDGAQAAIGGAVDKWFANQSYANVTPAGSYETQSGRMYTGGGVSTRSSIEPVFDFVSIQTPKVSAGCGGIDIYTGGFSYINKDQFVNSIRAIGQNAESLAFMMAIKIVTPQLEDLMNKVKGYAEKFNQYQTDSCQAASKILETGTKALGMTEQCAQARMSTKGEDRSTAINACTTGGKAGEATPGAAKNTVAFVEGNLAWNILMQDGYFRNDLDTAEVMMNIVGTVVLDKGTGADPAPKPVATITSLISKDITTESFKNIFNALYLGKKSGETLVMYKCNDRTANVDACRSLSTPTVIPVTWDGIKPRVDALLASMTKKILNGNNASATSFTAAEMGLVESTNLPLYRYIAAVTASQTRQFKDGENPAQEFSDLIGRDIVLRNVNNLIQRMKFRALNEKNNLADSPTVKAYIQQLDEAAAGITKMTTDDKEQMAALITMQNRVNEYEKKVLPLLSKSYVNAARFGH